MVSSNILKFHSFIFIQNIVQWSPVLKTLDGMKHIGGCEVESALTIYLLISGSLQLHSGITSGITQPQMPDLRVGCVLGAS